MSIHRERRRLGRAFQAALLAVGSPTIVIACTSSIPAIPFGSSASSPQDAGLPDAPDATQTDDGGSRDASPATRDARATDADAALDSAISLVAEGGEAGDAGPGTGTGGCFLRAYELDAGPDADAAGDICGYDYGCGLTGSGLTAVGCAVYQLAADGAAVPIPAMTCVLEQGQGCEGDAYAPSEGGLVTILCSCPTAGGRRPAGLRKPKGPRQPTALGSYFASMAFEEDASVFAFARMREELAALGAPAGLVAEAIRAESDEVRHARAMARLAGAADVRAHAGKGTVGTLERARVRRIAPRSAAAVAAENMAEGCVRETYGALVARWQSIHAGSAELRRAFSRIASDEARHAALSWTVASWLRARLDASGRRRVARSQSRALKRLRAAACVEPPRELVQAAGLPPAHEASALLDTLSRELGLTRAPKVSRAARR